MTQSVLLVALLFAFVSVATTTLLAEFGPRAAEKRPGADLGVAFFGLGSAFLGGAVASRGLTLEAVFEMAVVLAALVAVGYGGFYLENAPIEIPLCALALVIGAALFHGTPGIVLLGAAAGVPFLAGMIWPPRRAEAVRDAVVSALAGALLGFGIGVGAAILGTFAALVAASILRRKTKEAVLAPRFAPYIAVATAFAITISALVAV